jgi:hypothetical protein
MVWIDVAEVKGDKAARLFLETSGLVGLELAECGGPFAIATRRLVSFLAEIADVRATEVSVNYERSESFGCATTRVEPEYRGKLLGQPVGHKSIDPAELEARTAEEAPTRRMNLDDATRCSVRREPQREAIIELQREREPIDVRVDELANFLPIPGRQPCGHRRTPGVYRSFLRMTSCRQGRDCHVQMEFVSPVKRDRDRGTAYPTPADDPFRWRRAGWCR